MLYVCVGIGFVDWLEKGFIIWEKFWNMFSLMAESDCPEVTCAVDIKIQLLTN